MAIRQPVRRRSWSLGVAAGLLGTLAAACGGPADSGSSESSGNGEVVVFVAASLADVFAELADAFASVEPDLQITINAAASSALATQIIEGAPADIFAAADPATMARLVDADATAGTPEVIATNRAQMVVAAQNPLGLGGLQDLVNDELVLVVCAPEVPCGAYALQIFAAAGIAPTPDSYEENVRAVMGKVAMGEADAGIVYATDIAAAGDEVSGVEIPAELNVRAEYPIVLTAEATNPAAARAFIEFVRSEAGQSILAAHGFGPP